MAERSSKKKLPKIAIPSSRTEDQFATRKLLYLVRDELKSEIRSSSKKIDQQLEEIKTTLLQVAVSVEEQRSDNRITLEYGDSKGS